MKFPLILRVSGRRDLEQHLSAIGTVLLKVSFFAIPASSTVQLGTTPDGVVFLDSTGQGGGWTVKEGRVFTISRGGWTSFRVGYVHNPTAEALKRLIAGLRDLEFAGAYLDCVHSFASASVAAEIAALNTSQ